MHAKVKDVTTSILHLCNLKDILGSANVFDSMNSTLHRKCLPGYCGISHYTLNTDICQLLLILISFKLNMKNSANVIVLNHDYFKCNCCSPSQVMKLPAHITPSKFFHLFTYFNFVFIVLWSKENPLKFISPSSVH